MTAGKKFSTAQQQACAYLREKILAGELLGEKSLDPGVIATRLGISRMPVREALRQLDAEGLVTMYPNRKAVVTKLTVSEVEDLFEIRAAIEVLAIRSAMAAMDSKAIADLRLLAERMNNASSNWKAWMERHDDFHAYISELSGRPRLAQEIVRFSQAVQPYLLIAMTSSGKSQLDSEEHSRLVDVFAMGNVAAAEAVMADHVLRARSIALKGLELRDKGLELRDIERSDPGSRPAFEPLPEKNGELPETVSRI